MNELTIFEYAKKPVRTVMKGVEPWFVAKDVCDVLGLMNSREALSSLDEDEKGVSNTDTLGGKQEIAVVSEPGLYKLIFRSRKDTAKAFTRWVTHEVLPALRRGETVSAPKTKTDALLAALGEVKNADARQEIVVSLVGAELGSEAEKKLRTAIEGRYYTTQDLARIFETTAPAINKIARACELKTYLRGSNEFGRWQRVREGCVDRIWVYSEVGKDFISRFFVRSLKCPW
ncbi:MAG: Bro-N domain-containing protein [Pyramidobacter porci]|uniref:BRO-N domain-containing protein n=1 Tax=Pyramidobacter porci TaxID=2605789 RepID=UPI002A755D2F|nr:Bro-N domain-containing protein [Pyramidobacter porci]MDY2648764.1 Bro-N domain-containing protein [Pyramidobacter porci]